jgi:hypothetical protein
LPQSSAITRTMATIGVLTVTFLGYNYYSQGVHRTMLEEQKRRVEEERQRAEKYHSQLKSVLAERKTTRFRVIRSQPPAEGQGPPVHTLRVGQWNDKAERVFSRDLQISGNKIYFEGVVIHFQPEKVTEGKGNLHLLTRIFSDTVPPKDGVMLLDEQLEAADKLARAEVPLVEDERRLNVLRYLRRVASDQDYASAEGVRTLNAQAVADYHDLSESFVYTLVEQAGGGYLIERAPIP